MIDCGICVLRPWDERDVGALVSIANDWRVARFMHDRFPFPYTLDDAKAWMEHNRLCPAGVHYAIECMGELSGGISAERLTQDMRGTAHLGYWLGRAFQGRGIATAACRALTEHIFATTDVLRIESAVFAPNAASARVLEKCGYVLEGIKRRAIIKGTDVYDLLMYARLRE